MAGLHETPLEQRFRHTVTAFENYYFDIQGPIV
jgi:hypothetical protein